jgi:hypothetical protein
MDSKKLLEVINRLVKSQVKRELKKHSESIRAEIISEVAGMLSYSERKILMELSETSTPNFRQPIDESSVGGGTDFQRAMKNLKSMPNYRGVDNVEAPPKRITSNPLLNEILNETEPLTGEFNASSIMDQYSGHDVAQFDEPWANQPSQHQPVPAPITRVPDTLPSDMTGIDGKPINLENPTVQKVMDTLMNTNFKEKFDRIAEAGDNFRGAGATAPRFNTKYFEETTVN